MKDSKTVLLLLVSLLLVLVSFALIWTWGYNYYAKTKNLPQQIEPALLVKPEAPAPTNDSLQRAFIQSLQKIDAQLDSTLLFSDSLKMALDSKLAEFYRLRAEISDLLTRKNTAAGIATTRQKINELQNRADDLKTRNNDVQTENESLRSVLSKIKSKESVPLNEDDERTAAAAVTENRGSPVATFSASGLSVKAIHLDNGTEAETADASKTNRLVCSFNVADFNSQLVNAEIVAVLTAPGGRVLRNSAWDAGSFSTPAGKKLYSTKFNFSYSRGEQKKLEFVVNINNPPRGNYTLEIYNNGVLIGRMLKTLF